MNRLLLALFAVLAMLSISAAQDGNCPIDHIWTPCGSKCPPSCSQPNPQCEPACIPQCICKPDLIKDDTGKCVKECPK